jgi:putative LPXTG-motif protein cell wall anchor domain protein
VISTEVQVTPVKETEVSAQDKKVLEDHIDENVNIAQYLDINILVKAEDQVIGEVNELDKEVTFTVAIPEDLMKEGRTFYVIRVHDGKAEKLETVENEDGTLTFKTDKFSTYALAYEDAQESITTPITPVQPAQPGQSQDDVKGETVVTPDNNQQVTNTQNTQETAKEPKTGDTSNIALYGAMALISLGLVGAIVLKKKVSEK